MQWRLRLLTSLEDNVDEIGGYLGNVVLRGRLPPIHAHIQIVKWAQQRFGWFRMFNAYMTRPNPDPFNAYYMVAVLIIQPANPTGL